LIYARSRRKRLGEYLRERRRQLGRTLTELARVARVAYTTLRAWELGSQSPRLEHIGQICFAYQITAEVLRQVLAGGQTDK
jgi:transcriptional regulator with XRE-family HTH domain